MLFSRVTREPASVTEVEASRRGWLRMGNRRIGLELTRLKVRKASEGFMPRIDWEAIIW